MAKHGDWYWHELMTPDAAKGAAFYTALFGWTSSQMPMPGGMGGSYTVFKQAGGNEMGDGGAMQMSGPMFEGVPPHWQIYVQVDDVDASLKKVAQLGGSVVAPAFDVPTIGRMAVIKDPTGAHIAIITPAPRPA